MQDIVVNITYQLTGEKAAAFLALKQDECIENNAELARSLMVKQMREELHKRNIDIPGAQPKNNSISAPRRRNAQQG